MSVHDDQPLIAREGPAVMTPAQYAREVAGRFGRSVAKGEVLAKILTANDDSGRHGVLIPSEAYSFFPELPIPDPKQNATLSFDAFDAVDVRPVHLAWKYYQRYPERRITRVNGLANETAKGRRLVVFHRLQTDDGQSHYFVDVALEHEGSAFARLVATLFGRDVPAEPGAFVRLAIEAAPFRTDATLQELLAKFDGVRKLGWIDSMRAGDTGIGYTFETLLGIAENNRTDADFKGIEIKCKEKKDGTAGGGKINLFQQAPNWTQKLSGLERLRMLGQQDDVGRYNCHSQVTITPNNLGLRLEVREPARRVGLLKQVEEVGFWPYQVLQKRLEEKHSRAVFVKASVRDKKTAPKYHYQELVYCERPTIDQFISLVGSKEIVFEFIMSEKPDGSVRNHGYPWRLSHEDLLDRLFSLQVKLR